MPIDTVPSYQASAVPPATARQVQDSARSWFAHLARADTWRLRERLIAEFRERAGLLPDRDPTLEPREGSS